MKRLLVIAVISAAALFGDSAGVVNTAVSCGGTSCTLSATAGITNFDITLTSNTTASVFAASGSSVTNGSFKICNTGVAYTFVFPSGATGFGTISTSINTCSRQSYKFDGSFLQATGAMSYDAAGTPSGIGPVGVGLGSVTNDVQTKAAVVPNTAPSAGQVLAGNAGGTAYAPVTVTGDATMTSAGVVSLTAALKAWQVNLTIFDPVPGDSGRVQFRLPFAGTVTSISCSVKAATSVTINIEKRAVATPDTAGTAALTANLPCDTDSAVSTTFTSAGIAADIPVALVFSAVTGTPDTLRVHIKGTID